MSVYGHIDFRSSKVHCTRGAFMFSGALRALILSFRRGGSLQAAAAGAQHADICQLSPPISVFDIGLRILSFSRRHNDRRVRYLKQEIFALIEVIYLSLDIIDDRAH